MEKSKQVYLILEELYKENGTTLIQSTPLKAFESRTEAEFFVKRRRANNAKDNGSEYKVTVDWFIEYLPLYLDNFNGEGELK